MSRLSPIRIMAAVTVGVVAGALFIAVIGVSGVGTAPGMNLPVQAGLAAMLAVAIGAMLLTLGRPTPSAHEPRTETCASCGGDVYHEWRLCPHCGSWLHQK